MSELGILIVNLNNLQYTKDCISDILLQNNNNYHITLIDQNSSENGTLEYLEYLLSVDKVTVIKNSSNVDLNYLWNEFYKNSNTDYLCFLNNDIRLTNNFVDDTINILNNNINVGIVIHVTNNLNHTISTTLNHKILETPLYQGWDFSIRKKLYPLIPNGLRIFGGDDYIFGVIYRDKIDVSMCFSSPIIHIKEGTRKKTGQKTIDIHKNDIEVFKRIKTVSKIPTVKPTFTTPMCNIRPPKNIKLKNGI